MKIKNQILNYFVMPKWEQVYPEVFYSPVTMNTETWREVFSKENKAKTTKPLHVCFDLDSEILYVPNANEFMPEQTKMYLDAVKIKILKEFGNFSGKAPIEGSPFSSLRVRKISSFGHVYNSVLNAFKNVDDIPVIEANLARMPTTKASLPCLYHSGKNYMGGYIGENISPEITFCEEIDIKGRKIVPRILLRQKAPFILIDVSPTINPSSVEKEWTVISGYRDHLSFNPEIKMDDISMFSDLYAAKRHLYLGWPFEEVCELLLSRATNFGELIKGMKLLSIVAKSIEDEGYVNPSKDHYYMSFKVDPKTFPLRIESVMNELGQFDSRRQIDVFQFIEYNKDTGEVIIETPAYINTKLCISVLRAKSKPFICKYNSATRDIAIKSDYSAYKELLISGNQIGKIEFLIGKEVLKNHSITEKIKFSKTQNADYKLRKISEYYYACDHIKKMCKKRGVAFVDMDVIVGPTERLFGRGVAGGFMSAKSFEKSKIKIPHEMVKGIFVSPPIMAVDSASMPSYSQQTETLIHEYSHNLYNMTNPDHEHLYNKDPSLKEKDKFKYWDLYLSDEDERIAHKEEIRYMIMSGETPDEIIRDKIGGMVCATGANNNYPIAVKFKSLVEEVVKEIEEEIEK